MPLPNPSLQISDLVGVHVMFLHGGSACKDGTERDGAFDEGQWRQKKQRGVLWEEQKPQGALA
jgi:hypothetical protein